MTQYEESPVYPHFQPAILNNVDHHLGPTAIPPRLESEADLASVIPTRPAASSSYPRTSPETAQLNNLGIPTTFHLFYDEP